MATFGAAADLLPQHNPRRKTLPAICQVIAMLIPLNPLLFGKSAFFTHVVVVAPVGALKSARRIKLVLPISQEPITGTTLNLLQTISK
jgi:hypothetical protein